MKYGFSLLMTMLMSLTANAQVKAVKTVAPKIKESSQESITISQFERAGESDFLIDRNNHYHVVFQESPANGKPFLFIILFLLIKELVGVGLSL